MVATEVRNLASRSAAAAKEIKALIRDSGEKVRVGAELVNESGVTLTEIVTAVKRVGDIVAEIAAASAEQAAGIDQVNQAVTSMDELTQQNAALAEQTSAASASLYEKAQEMREMMGFFKMADAAPTDDPTVAAKAPRSMPVSRAASLSRTGRLQPGPHTTPEARRGASGPQARSPAGRRGRRVGGVLRHGMHRWERFASPIQR